MFPTGSWPSVTGICAMGEKTIVTGLDMEPYQGFYVATVLCTAPSSAQFAGSYGYYPQWSMCSARLKNEVTGGCSCPTGYSAKPGGEYQDSTESIVKGIVYVCVKA